MDQTPDDRMYNHLLTILSVSAGMVGVCLTAIGLIGIAKTMGRVETFVDDMLAVSSLLFTLASALSFLGLRTNISNRWEGFAWMLDAIFFLGIITLVISSAALTWVVV